MVIKDLMDYLDQLVPWDLTDHLDTKEYQDYQDLLLVIKYINN